MSFPRHRKTKTEYNINVDSDLKAESLEGFCQCCLSENNLRSLLQPYECDEMFLDYAEMINTCFSTELIKDMEKNDVLYLICDLCVLKLRASYAFRKLLEEVQLKLRNTVYQAFLSQDIQVKRGDGYSLYDEENISIRKELKTKPRRKYAVEIEEIDPRIITPNKIVGTKPKTSCEIIYGDIDDSIVIFRPGKPRDRASGDFVNSVKIHKLQKTNNSSCEITKDELDNSLQILKLPKSKMILRKNEMDKLKTDLSDSDVEDSVKILKSGKNKIKIPMYVLDKSATTCDRCMETFSSHRELVSHAPTHFPNFLCSICGKAFLFLYNLKNHLTIHATEKVTCDICNVKLIPRYMLKHMKKHNGQTDNMTCPHCPERFAAYGVKLQHLLEVHGIQRKRFQCKMCPKNYSLPHHRAAHVRKHHLQERNHVCTECGKAFFTSTWLKEHILRHRGDRRFQCEICMKTFYKKYDLTKHISTHTDVEEHVCSLCDESFPNKYVLKAHINAHKECNEISQN